MFQDYCFNRAEGTKVGWSDFYLFWNLKIRHRQLDYGCTSKTKIEKAFFYILRKYQEHLVFV